MIPLQPAALAVPSPAMSQTQTIPTIDLTDSSSRSRLVRTLGILDQRLREIGIKA